MVQHNGQCYFKAGGLLMDMRTYRLIPGVKSDSNFPVIYGMGPVTYGQVAFPQDLSVITTCAERIVEQLETDFQLGDNIRKENQRRIEADQEEADRCGFKFNAKGYLSANMREMSKAIYEIQPRIVTEQ